MTTRYVLVALAGLSVTGSGRATAQDTALVGLWHARLSYGPAVRGELLLVRSGDTWHATIAGRAGAVRDAGDSVVIDFPTGGAFTGRLTRDRKKVVGHWITPRLLILNVGGRYATPVTLTSCGTSCYAGPVQPLEDQFTFYMEVRPRPDGTLGAFLRNPERNQGRFIRADNILRRGDTVDLRDARDSVLQTGLLRGGVISGVSFRGSTFDFRRVHPDSFTFYYPRGRRTSTYSYAPPRVRNDGWAVGRARDVGLSEEKLAEMVRTFANASVDSTNAYRPHAIVVARNGRLVLEEYFFGEHADKPHDTRSASKTFLTVVIGAAMHAGMRVSPETPVYATMSALSPDLDARKRAMTLRHLLTMSSGLDCDDNGERRPGNEDLITSQDTNPDWTRMILGLAMLRDAGERAVYCSINPHLAGEVLARATRRPFLDLAWELVGEPLQMRSYHVAVAPSGVAYNGGGAYFLARDFLKLAQLYASGGTWNGRRIVSEAWIRESVEPRYQMGRSPNYGYLWWSSEYEHQGRRLRAYHASGNGGQFSIYFPELGLVIATLGGNYADSGGFFTLRELIPRYILPAVVR